MSDTGSTTPDAAQQPESPLMLAHRLGLRGEEAADFVRWRASEGQQQ